MPGRSPSASAPDGSFERDRSGPRLAPDGRYDVIIAGASFGGLAVAQHLRAGPRLDGQPRCRVLVLDRQAIGEGVTSACAAPVRIVEQAGAGGAIQQVHEALVIHTPGGRATWPLPEPFCTFDYRRYCQDAAAAAGIHAPSATFGAGGSGAVGGIEFRLASVHGRDGQCVVTSAGAFEGRILVDATGPRAALAGPRRPRYAAFGLESEVGHRVEPGLHFFFVPEVRDGYAWAFPCGEGTRFGVLSYRGRTKLREALGRFMARFGTRPGGLHGGYLTTGWARGAADPVFVIGDAAGQCLPLSGEGIRTAVLAGARCGALLHRVLDGTMTLDAARATYRAFIAADRRRYRALLAGNLLLLGWPQGWLGWAARVLARPAVRRWFFAHYLGIFGTYVTLQPARPDGQVTLHGA
ncbi:MAG: hypothetical protein QN131_04905 [Armatimonadota bacterium]|nr:hypothetical protein [Armatimonadota bacterium]MDR7549266.1 hypothetical protein [Armatimonadota bacterium]